MIMKSTKLDSAHDDLSAHAKPALLALSVLVECIQSRHSAMLALPVLIERLQSLPSADRDDFLELLGDFGRVEDADEERYIVRAMEEILAQAPVVAHQMAMDDEPMPKGLKAWSEDVGAKIRELRKKASMSQSELAAKAGLDQGHVSRIENAEYSATHMTLEKIANALGVSVRDLDVCLE
jgi:DNA-binding XRE family transcriptional regulator